MLQYFKYLAIRPRSKCMLKGQATAMRTTQCKEYLLIFVWRDLDKSSRGCGCASLAVLLHAVTLLKNKANLSNHHHHSKSLITHRSFRHASSQLWYITQNSASELLIPSQRPSFKHAALSCYTLLSPSITCSLFHSELKTYLFRKSYPPP